MYTGRNDSFLFLSRSSCTCKIQKHLNAPRPLCMQFWQKYSVKTLATTWLRSTKVWLTLAKLTRWCRICGSWTSKPRRLEWKESLSWCTQLLLACSSALVHFSTRNANLIPGFHYTRAHPLYSPSINFNSNLYRATLQVILELNYAFWGCSLWSCADILQFNIIQILEFKFCMLLSTNHYYVNIAHWTARFWVYLIFLNPDRLNFVAYWHARRKSILS